ncbi:phosphatidylinositol 3-kinase 2-like, partial [Octopus sinensis]|uniref:Phosphatidylinositol 3-kinase 2-like n=1 Tax=Octopus sinensis TaxID=2607531 RepID=A0A6P7U115_9MOLL
MPTIGSSSSSSSSSSSHAVAIVTISCDSTSSDATNTDNNNNNNNNNDSNNNIENRTSVSRAPSVLPESPVLPLAPRTTLSSPPPLTLQLSSITINSTTANTNTAIVSVTIFSSSTTTITTTTNITGNYNDNNLTSTTIFTATTNTFSVAFTDNSTTSNTNTNTNTATASIIFTINTSIMTSASISVPVRLIAVITIAVIQFLVAVGTASAQDLYEGATQQLPSASASFDSVDNRTEEEAATLLVPLPQENSTLVTTDQPEHTDVTILDESILTTQLQEISSVSQRSQPADIHTRENNEKKSIDKNGRVTDITQKRIVVDKSDSKIVVQADRDVAVAKNDSFIEGLVSDDHGGGGGGDGILMKERISKSTKVEEPIIFKSDLDILQQQLKRQNQELADLRMRLSESDIALIDIETKFYKYLQTERLVSDGTEHDRNILKQRLSNQDTKLKQIPSLFDCQNSFPKKTDFDIFRNQVEDNLKSILKELDYLRAWRQDYLKQTTELAATETFENTFQSASVPSEQSERDKFKEIKDNSSMDLQKNTSKVFENLSLENNSISKHTFGAHLKHDFSNITSQTDDITASTGTFNITEDKEIEEFVYLEKLLQEINQKVDTSHTRLDNLEENMMLSMENVSQILSLSQEFLNGNITFLQFQINQIFARLESKQNQSEINIYYEELKPNFTRLINEVYEELKTGNTIERGYNDTADTYVLPLKNSSKVVENVSRPLDYTINASLNFTNISQINGEEAYSDFSSELISVKQNFTELYRKVENVGSNYAGVSQRLDRFSRQLSSIMTRLEQDTDHQNGLSLNKLSLKSKSVSSHLDVLNEDYKKDVGNLDSKQSTGLKSNESFFQSTEYLQSTYFPNTSTTFQNKTEDKLFKWISKNFFRNITSDEFLTLSDISETSKTGENALCYNFSDINDSNSEVSILKTFLEHLGSMLIEVKNHLNIMCSETNRTSDRSGKETTINSSSVESETFYENISENSTTSENITFPDDYFDTRGNSTFLSSIKSTHGGIKHNINKNHSALHNSTLHSFEEVEGKENKTVVELEQYMFSLDDMENETLPGHNFSGVPHSKHLERIYFEIKTLSLRIDVLENKLLLSNKEPFTDMEANETIPFAQSEYRGSGSLDSELTEDHDVLQNLISNLTQIQKRFECLNSNVQLQEKQLSSVKMNMFKLNERVEHFTQENSGRQTESIMLAVENTKDDISKLIEDMSEISHQVSSFSELNLTDTLRNVQCHLEEHQTEIRNLKEVMEYQNENKSMVFWKRQPVEEKILYVGVQEHKRQKDLNKTIGKN